MYEPGDDGAAGQYVRGDAATALTGALGFLTGTARVSDFAVALRARSANQPEHTDALELRPRRPDPRYARVLVHVDDRDGSPRRISIEDAEGNWNRFDLSEQETGAVFPGDAFEFTPPEGARDMTNRRG